jgi:hypothetical protein
MHEEALGYLLAHHTQRNPRTPLSEEYEEHWYINIVDESLSLFVFNFCN